MIRRKRWPWDSSLAYSWVFCPARVLSRLLFWPRYLESTVLVLFLSSLLTNTWLSISVFFGAAKIGSWLLKISYPELYTTLLELKKSFTWSSLFHLSFSQVIYPLALGYVIVSLALGLSAYSTTLLVLKKIKRRHIF